MPQHPQADVAAKIASLETLSLPELRARWTELYGQPPPKAARREYLIRGAAYRIQENAYGGLPAPVLRSLNKLIAESGSGARKWRQPARQLTQGSRLLRDWNGETHEVIVAGAGYRYRDHEYRSLSEIARAITGTRWSGPLFFGLKAVSRGASSQPSQRSYVVDLTTESPGRAESPAARA